KGDILLCGHTHIPKCAEHEGFVYMNPGSVSIPKEGSDNIFGISEIPKSKIGEIPKFNK
ncbi:MAG: metallophosphoesterase family protein, partial [Candidatus Nanoarchaeia archaeon]|nr:metallophosphoesterase family protein [Candidatus Nanoarchaeia archaeon]